MVGAEGFEPPAFCSQSRRATRLRYAPPVKNLTDQTKKELQALPGPRCLNWQARQDLNPRSTDLESVALANYATGLHQINIPLI